MRILAFESSCDDTAVAYLDVADGRVNRLVSVVSTQVVHAAYGGVVPEVAARQHDVTLPLVLAEVARQVTGSADGRELAKVVDAVAATAGPGLVTSLRVGLDAARALAAAWGVPFFGINHIDGHVYANWLDGEGLPLRLPEDASCFPALALVVSGGHTELLLMSGHGDYRLLGATRDDAAGEAFDKVAKLLGLGFPGGPKISALAEGGDARAFDFPRPMVADPGDEFSFSGLKTAVRREVEKAAETDYPEFAADVAASAERAIVDTLVAKAVAAAEREDVRTVLLCGGVSANKLLRRELRAALSRRAPNAVFLDPKLAYCPDNAAMIAVAAYFRSQRDTAGDDWAAIEAQPGWEVGR
jgi:N6-L-threonylcarbamoyladenine synthase